MGVGLGVRGAEAVDEGVGVGVGDVLAVPVPLPVPVLEVDGVPLALVVVVDDGVAGGVCEGVFVLLPVRETVTLAVALCAHTTGWLHVPHDAACDAAAAAESGTTTTAPVLHDPHAHAPHELITGSNRGVRVKSSSPSAPHEHSKLSVYEVPPSVG